MISVNMEGVKDAVETLKDMIIPFYRNNAQRKLRLENAQRQAEIHKTNAEALLVKVKAERERAASEIDRNQAELILAQAKKTEAEAELILAQAEKERTQLENERALFRQAQLGLAVHIIERYNPNINEEQKLSYIHKLLPVLDILTWNEIVPD